MLYAAADYLANMIVSKAIVNSFSIASVFNKTCSFQYSQLMRNG